jgi:hypothetical protein
MNELRQDYQKLKIFRKLSTIDPLKSPIVTVPTLIRYNDTSVLVKQRNTIVEASISYHSSDTVQSGYYITDNNTVRVQIHGGLIPKSVNFLEYYRSLIDKNYLTKEVFIDEQILLQILNKGHLCIDLKIVNGIGHANIKKLIYHAIKNILKSTILVNNQKIDLKNLFDVTKIPNFFYGIFYKQNIICEPSRIESSIRNGCIVMRYDSSSHKIKDLNISYDSKLSNEALYLSSIQNIIKKIAEVSI